MSKYLEESAVEPIAEPFTPSQEPLLPPFLDVSSEVAATSHATSEGSGTNSQPVLWQPSEAQYTKAIAEYYGVSRKSVQEWFQKVLEVCPWFTEADLKLPDERYTPLCVELMGDYRLSKMPLKAWKAKVWEQNPELVAAYQQAQQTFPPPFQSDPLAQIELYQRSEHLMSLLDQRQLPQYDYTNPDENPVVVALKERLNQQTAQNVETKTRLAQFTQATSDTHLAYETLEELEAIQEGESIADRLFFLREQAKQRRLEELKMAMLGKPAATSNPSSAA